MNDWLTENILGYYVDTRDHFLCSFWIWIKVPELKLKEGLSIFKIMLNRQEKWVGEADLDLIQLIQVENLSYCVLEIFSRSNVYFCIRWVLDELDFHEVIESTIDREINLMIAHVLDVIECSHAHLVLLWVFLCCHSGCSTWCTLWTRKVLHEILGQAIVACTLAHSVFFSKFIRWAAPSTATINLTEVIIPFVYALVTACVLILHFKRYTIDFLAHKN